MTALIFCAQRQCRHTHCCWWWSPKPWPIAVWKWPHSARPCSMPSSPEQTKFQSWGLRSGEEGSHISFGPKVPKHVLAELMHKMTCVQWCSVLLKHQRSTSILGVDPRHNHFWQKIQVHCLVHLHTLLNEVQGHLSPVCHHAHPHHHRWQILPSEGWMHLLGDVLFASIKHSVILSIVDSLDGEQLFICPKHWRRHITAQLPKNFVAMKKTLDFGGFGQQLVVTFLVGEQAQVVWHQLPHHGHANGLLIHQLPDRSGRIPPALLQDSLHCGSCPNRLFGPVQLPRCLARSLVVFYGSKDCSYAWDALQVDNNCFHVIASVKQCRDKIWLLLFRGHFGLFLNWFTFLKELLRLPNCAKNNISTWLIIFNSIILKQISVSILVKQAVHSSGIQCIRSVPDEAPFLGPNCVTQWSYFTG